MKKKFNWKVFAIVFPLVVIPLLIIVGVVTPYGIQKANEVHKLSIKQKDKTKKDNLLILKEKDKNFQLFIKVSGLFTTK